MQGSITTQANRGWGKITRGNPVARLAAHDDMCVTLRKLFRDDTVVGHVTVKGRSDYMTEVDTSVQQTLYRRLTARYPQIQFMGEEKDNSEIDFDRPVWILDPVDGTTNLIHHFPASCIALALYQILILNLT